MNFLSLLTKSSFIGQGIAYLLAPEHRLLLMIFAGIVVILAIRFIVQSIKILIFVALIIAAIFFGVQFLQGGI